MIKSFHFQIHRKQYRLHLRHQGYGLRFAFAFTIDLKMEQKESHSSLSFYIFSLSKTAQAGRLTAGLGGSCLLYYAGISAISAILAFHCFGPVSCTEVPLESTATVTGMSLTSNS